MSAAGPAPIDALLPAQAGSNASMLPIMDRIDALYLEDPYSGWSQMLEYLAREGIPIRRDHVRNLMRRMDLQVMYQKPRTTVSGNPSERFPCLMVLNQIMAVNQVWATDNSCLPLQRNYSTWRR